MNRSEDRRSPATVRVSHAALVDICIQDAEASPFQGESSNISGRGMHVRTCFLPEIGEGLVCRFNHGDDEILVEGVVAWRSESTDGGEFGIQFTALDADSAEVLQEIGEPSVTKKASLTLSPRAPAVVEEEELSNETEFLEMGSRVRLHIDGLGAPMKACVHEGSARKVRVGSSLEFLKLGRSLDLENVALGQRRGAQVDSVNVVMNPSTQVPELVVQLRYEGVSATPPPAEAERGPVDFDDEAFGSVAARTTTEDGEPELEDEEQESWEPAAEAIRERLSQAMSSASAVAQKAGGVLSVLARSKKKPARTTKRTVAVEDKPLRAQTPGKRRLQTSRRRTGAAPSHLRSGIHDLGLGSRARPSSAPARPSKAPPETKKKRRIPAAGVFGVAFLVFGGSAFALRGYSDESPKNDSTPAVSAQQKAPPKKTAVAKPPAKDVEEEQGIVAEVPLFGPQAMAVKKAEEAPSSVSVAEAEKRAAAASVEDQSWDEPASDEEVVEAKPWGRGRLYLPTIHRIRLDGAGATLAGAVNSDGFTVVVPGRKAMESGKAIEKRDKRIVGVLTNNNARGATVKFEFRGPVPPYRVRLRQDFVEFLISAPEDSVARL